MTIERQWFEIMKTEVPDAFQENLCGEITQRDKAGFIDGQIKLMGMVGEHEWDAYFLKQFVQPIQKMMELNASIIVLAFDDYEHVPRAKYMTQAKRRKNLEPYVFCDGDSFPCRPPEPWDAAMANRTFKATVIQWIIDELAAKLIFPAGITVIVDWKGDYCTHLFYRNGILMKQEMDRNQTGEADIKFLQWSKKLQMPMVVDAIDGDFVPIALAGQCQDIFIYRYKVLKQPGEGISHEWVHIDQLRRGMVKAFQQMNGKELLKTWPGWELDCLLALIGLTGTDYTRGLPWVGPKKLWTILPHILSSLVNICCENTNDGFSLNPEQTATVLYGVIYAKVYGSHVKNTQGLFSSVMKELDSSKLSSKTKSMFPSYERAVCTAKNINFLWAYWNNCAPDSLEGKFGFRERGDAVEWDD